MSIQNLATQETFPLAVGSTITLGRGSHGIHSPYISRKQVEITYLDDHRCFVKKVSDRIMLLNDAALPFQQEFQLKNGDVLGFPISNEAEKNSRIRFMLILPELDQPLVRLVDTIGPKDSNTTIENSSSSCSSSDTHESDLDDDDDDDSDDDEEDINLSDISSESDEITSRLFKQKQSR